MSFFEPSPVFLAFIFVKSFVYPGALAALALLRLLLARGPARAAAAGALAAALAVLATVLAPPLGLSGGALHAALARGLAHGGGMTVLVLLSALFAVSSVLPGRRARWIDALHIMLFLGLVGLWVATLI